MSDENNKSESMNGDKAEKGAESDESFAALLEERRYSPERLHPGRKVRAKIVGISKDLVYIDLGGKSEGAIDLGEFTDDHGEINAREGDEIEAFFVNVRDGLKILTTLINGYPAAALNHIRNAYESNLRVNGDVRCAVKGGFDVSVGGIKCFCPASHIDQVSKNKNTDYIGRSFAFRILEYEENGRNIVVSRKVLLEEEKRARIEELKGTLSEGMDVMGKVGTIHKFGVFVDIGGVDALIPISELSWGRTGSPEDIVSPGQEITARIISLDWENKRLTLSLKAMQPDPWVGIADKYSVDDRITGTVVRLAPFGAFVSIEDGIDGLVHISNLVTGRRINHPKEVVNVGQRVEVYVLSVDPQNRKISLSMQPKPEPKEVILPSVGELVDGTVEKVMPYGVFMKISDDLSGLIPNMEMGTPRGTDHNRMFQAGADIQAIVKEVDPKSRKISLSRKKAIARAEREELDKYRASAKDEDKSSDGIGSLGEMLKARMEEKNISF